MAYSVERALQLRLADVPRLLDLANGGFLVLLLSTTTTAIVRLLLLRFVAQAAAAADSSDVLRHITSTRRQSGLARAQGTEHLEAQPCQTQLLHQVRYRRLLQVPDDLPCD